MEESFNHIDQLFKERLQNYEVNPPDHIWSNIHEKIQKPGTGGGSKGFIPGSGIFGLIIVLIMSGVFYYYQYSHQSQTGIQGDYPEEYAYNETASGNEEALNINANASEKAIQAARQPEHLSNISVVSHTPALTPENEPAGNNANYTEPEAIQNNGHHTSDVTFLNTSKERKTLSSLRNKSIDQLNNQSGPYDNSTALDFRHSGEINDGYFDVKKQVLFTNPAWIFGLHLNPEIVLNNPDGDAYKRSYGIELSARMQFSSYFAESGFGFSLSEDDGKSTVDFERYEFLGSYEDVYEVTFDTTEAGIIPVYHTQLVDVYDSIRHISITNTKNLYTYFQIPLYIGYTLDAKRLGFTFKAGPVLSLLSYKKENIDYPYNDIRILNQSSDLPSRLNTYWTMLVSAGINYRISRKLSFSVEPGFRYYLNSVYRDPQKNLNKPYSIGLRTGILINID